MLATTIHTISDFGHPAQNHVGYIKKKQLHWSAAASVKYFQWEIITSLTKN
jgi:hypothetical protein